MAADEAEQTACGSFILVIYIFGRIQSLKQL